MTADPEARDTVAAALAGLVGSGSDTIVVLDGADARPSRTATPPAQRRSHASCSCWCSHARRPASSKCICVTTTAAPWAAGRWPGPAQLPPRRRSMHSASSARRTRTASLGCEPSTRSPTVDSSSPCRSRAPTTHPCTASRRREPDRRSGARHPRRVRPRHRLHERRTPGRLTRSETTRTRCAPVRGPGRSSKSCRSVDQLSDRRAVLRRRAAMASTDPTPTMPAAIAAVGIELDEPVRGRPVPWLRRPPRRPARRCTPGRSGLGSTGRSSAHAGNARAEGEHEHHQGTQHSQLHPGTHGSGPFDSLGFTVGSCFNSVPPGP